MRKLFTSDKILLSIFVSFNLSLHFRSSKEIGLMGLFLTVIVIVMKPKGVSPLIT